MTTRHTNCAIVPGAAYSRPEDGVALVVYAQPDAALVLGGLLLLISP